MNLISLTSLAKSSAAGPLSKIVIFDNDNMTTVRGAVYLNTLGNLFGYCAQQVRGESVYLQLSPDTAQPIIFSATSDSTAENTSNILYSGFNAEQIDYSYTTGYEYLPTSYNKSCYIEMQNGPLTAFKIISGNPINSCFNGCINLETIDILPTAAVNLDFVNLKNNIHLKSFSVLGTSNIIRKLLIFNYELDKICVIFNVMNCIIHNEEIQNVNPLLNALGTQSVPVKCLFLNYTKDRFSSSEISNANHKNITLINVK